MNRCLLGILILGLFLAVGLWSDHAMAAFHEPVSDALEQAAQTALAGNLEQAAEDAKTVQTKWQTHWNRIAILADHTPMDEIDALFARLEAFSAAGQEGDFAACARQLATRISATAEAHKLSWWNLL